MSKSWPLTTLGFLGLVVFVFLMAAHIGLRLNSSNSLAPGFYWLNTQQEARKGDIVFFCPPNGEVFQLAKQRGYLKFGRTCPGGFRPLIKKISAVTGDVISLTPKGLVINGALQKNSMPLPKDLQNRPMPTWLPTVIPQAHALFLSDYNRLSFDGRYFGPVHIGHIQGVATPLFTW